EEVVEVVGHAPGQSADGLDLLRLPELLLELAALGDVAEDGEVAAGKEVGARRELQLADAAVGPDDPQLALGAALPPEGGPGGGDVDAGRREVADPVPEERGAAEAVEAAGGGVH